MPAQEDQLKVETETGGVKNESSPGSETATRVKEEKVLFSWNAVSRPFKKRNKEFFVTIIAMAAIVGLILFFAEGFMPVLLIVALVFLYYVLNTVEPEVIEYTITNLGIKISGKRIDWDGIVKFWFSRSIDSDVLALNIKAIPNRMDLVIVPTDKQRIKELLKKYIPEEENPPTRLDKTVNWISEKLPGS